MTALLKKFLLSVVSIILFVAAAEVLVRLFDIDTFHKNAYFLINRDLDYPDVTIRDRDLFWRLKPNQTIASSFFDGDTIRINSLGMRGPEISGKSEKIRVVVLGNSCTFGWGVEEDSTFAAQLEKLLGKKYEVINAGIPGYSSFQGSIFLEKEISSLQPDILLILFAWNDHWPAAYGIEDKEQEFPSEFVISIQNQLNHLHSYRYLRKLVLTAVDDESSRNGESEPVVFRVQPADFESNLKMICSLARTSGTTPILLTSPIAELGFETGDPRRLSLYNFHREYNQYIRNVAQSDEIKMVDMAVVFAGHKNLFDNPNYDPIHFNNAGHRLAASLIASQIDSLSIHQ